jgi:hypothetical protein
MLLSVKKTNELLESEQYEIVEMFNSVFKKNRTIEQFRKLFLDTVLEYSYHVILYDDGVIGGCCSYLPSYYKIKNEKYLSVLSIDTMIDRKYRGQGYFREMLNSGIDYMRNDGVIFIINFPNDISYPRYIKLSLRQDIGSLITYVLPYRIGGIKPSLKTLNWLSIAFVNVFVFLSSLFADSKIHHFPIEKDKETYNKIRYNQPDGGYNIELIKGGGFVYKIFNYENIKAAFLMDVFDKSARNYNIAVRHILNNHKKEFDILLYVGHLPFGLNGFIKIPKCFSPKNFNFVGKLLNENLIEKELFFNINSWDVNLSNYDLL